ncbi:MAG: winged helix-turn-helix transcriptional regulator [Candidatus Omnitrophica bacterium]|nr:winged helix-turn-helix transcriptional regulator [Candidatus Omnitrophota bacterium]
MDSPFQISEIVGTQSAVAILRVLTIRKGLRATGREIAKLSGFSVPATHESLKNLQAHNILNVEVIGKQHIYSLNEEDRIVQKIIRPMFEAESNYKGEIRDLLLEEIKKGGIKTDIVSLILYGSVQQGTANKKSDVDVAVVVDKASHTKQVAEVFNSSIADRFKSYFGIHLDFYVKSAAEFRERLKKNLPPISTLMKSYSVLYGKEPLEV